MTQFLINMNTSVNTNTYVNTPIVKHIIEEHVYHRKDPNPQKLIRIHIPKNHKYEYKYICKYVCCKAYNGRTGLP